MSDETSIKPPEVVTDDHGFGAWFSGTLNYYIRVSEIETIHIEVVGYCRGRR
jgi:hypothetical protein